MARRDAARPPQTSQALRLAPRFAGSCTPRPNGQSNCPTLSGDCSEAMALARRGSRRGHLGGSHRNHCACTNESLPAWMQTCACKRCGWSTCFSGPPMSIRIPRTGGGRSGVAPGAQRVGASTRYRRSARCQLRPRSPPHAVLLASESSRMTAALVTGRQGGRRRCVQCARSHGGRATREPIRFLGHRVWLRGLHASVRKDQSIR